MSQIETIIAKAMTASKAWPAVFEAGNAAELTRAVLDALDAAGFVVVPRELREANTKEAVRIAISTTLSAEYRWPDYMRDIYIAMIETRLE